jgi:hypothetical protein
MLIILKNRSNKRDKLLTTKKYVFFSRIETTSKHFGHKAELKTSYDPWKQDTAPQVLIVGHILQEVNLKLFKVFQKRGFITKIMYRLIAYSNFFKN